MKVYCALVRLRGSTGRLFRSAPKPPVTFGVGPHPAGEEGDNRGTV